MSIIVWYYVIINIFLFLLMGLDKHYAKKRMRRIPEKWLLLLGIIGAPIGGLAGMVVFSHKTRKYYFALIYILALAGHIYLGASYFFKLY